MSSRECAQDGHAKATGAETAYFVRHPDVTLMDLVLPGISGLAALSRILARDQGAKVAMLTSHDYADLRRAALDLGAIA